MSKEHKRKPPVFTSAEEPAPVAATPKPQPKDDLDVMLAAEAEDVDESGYVEAVAEQHTSEPEAPSVEDALPHGWQLITPAQHDGKTYRVTHDLAVEGVEAFWRKTRVLSHYRWVLNGKWTLQNSRQEVMPQPVYFAEVN